MYRFSRSLFAFLLIASTFAYADEPPLVDRIYNIEDEIAAADRDYRPEPFVAQWTSQESVRLHSGLALSPDGSRVVACSRRGGYYVYDGGTGQLLAKRSEPFSSTVRKLVLTSTGDRAALALENGQVVIVETASGKELYVHRDSKQPILDLGLVDDDSSLSYIDADLVLRKAPLLGGTVVSARAEEERIDPSNVNIEQLQSGGEQSPLNLVSRKSVRGTFIRGDGLTSFLVPKGTNMITQLRLPEENKPATVSKKKLEALHPWLYASSPVGTTVLADEGILSYAAPLPGHDNAPFADYRIFLSMPGVLNFRATIGMGFRRHEAFVVGSEFVEIHRSDSFFHPTLHEIPLQNALQVALSVDSRRVAAVDEQGHVVLYALKQEPESPGRRFQLMLEDLIRRRQYDQFEAVAAALAKRKTTFPWNYRTNDYDLIFDALNSVARILNEPVMTGSKYFDEWLEAKPEGQIPRLMLSATYIRKAWAARGDGLAHTVTPQGWKGFEANLQVARKFCLDTVKMEEPSPGIYENLVSVAMGQGWDAIDLQKYLDRALELYPQHIGAHEAMVRKLMPRWGGRFADCNDYATRVANRLGGGEGDAAYARLARSLLDSHPVEEVFNQLQFDYERVQRGYRYLQSQPRRQAEGLHGELLFAYYRDDRPRVDALLEQMQREKTPYNPVYQSRGEYHHILRHRQRHETEKNRTHYLPEKEAEGITPDQLRKSLEKLVPREGERDPGPPPERVIPSEPL